MKFKSLHPEVHFSSVLDYCSSNKTFQCFQGNPLNRLNIHRKTLQDLVQHSQTRFLPYRQLKVLFSQEKKQPVWLTYDKLFQQSQLTIEQCELVVLGIGPNTIADRPTPVTTIEPTKIDTQLLNKFLLASEPTPDEYIYCALALPSTSPDSSLGSYVDLRPILPYLSVIDAALCGQGRALLDWHASYKFCGKCGSSTTSLEGGTRRKCTTCNHTIYPRTDPVCITLVIHSDGQRVLLGRKASFPGQVYTCLAGFIEPGESIPEACSREIWEESGVVIDTKQVQYFDSQPWPFLGGQLMIGCYAQAIDEQVALNDSELEDCRWFNRDEIGQMIQESLNMTSKNLRIPPPIAIAHQLISNWHTNTKNVV